MVAIHVPLIMGIKPRSNDNYSVCGYLTKKVSWKAFYFKNMYVKTRCFLALIIVRRLGSVEGITRQEKW